MELEEKGDPGISGTSDGERPAPLVPGGPPFGGGLRRAFLHSCFYTELVANRSLIPRMRQSASVAYTGTGGVMLFQWGVGRILWSTSE